MTISSEKSKSLTRREPLAMSEGVMHCELAFKYCRNKLCRS